jgi:hypothetical protein
MASTDLAAIEPGGYLALNHSLEEIQDIIAETLGGEQLTEFDLPRVKIPSGGSTTWEIPTLGGTEPSKTLSGILVHWKQTRAYWAPDANSNTPPQCRSEGVDTRAVGVGDPGGPCAICPLAQFGSAVDDRGNPAPGQACNKKEIWFLLQEGGALPLAVSLPATSLGPAKSYRMSFATGLVSMASFVTTITLEATKNAKGDPYAVIKPAIGGRLSDEESQRAKSYAAAFTPIFDAVAERMTTERGDAVNSTAEAA